MDKPAIIDIDTDAHVSNHYGGHMTDKEIEDQIKRQEMVLEIERVLVVYRGPGSTVIVFQRKERSL